MPKPTTLATGQLNKADELAVELHRPADLPAFILVVWPHAASVASPDNFDNLVAAVFRVLADARTTLARMRVIGAPGRNRTRESPGATGALTFEWFGDPARQVTVPQSVTCHQWGRGDARPGLGENQRASPVTTLNAYRHAG